MSNTHPQLLIEGDASAFGVTTLKASPSLSIARLTSGQEQEVLSFLAERPIHTFGMSGLIRDNGLVSPSNRGEFYACRDAAGSLVGIALIGHATLFEAHCDDVIIAFADFARTLPPMHIILGERGKVDLFWARYAAPGEPAPNVVESLLYEQRFPIEVAQPAPTLRRALLTDVEQVALVHAALAYDVSGVNPLEVDREGFMRRTKQRIELGRVWVCMKDGRLSFKADVVSESPDVIYVEGVYVAHCDRGKGHGFRCLARLSAALLEHTRSVAVLVTVENAPARALYARAGFKLKSHYHMIYPRAGMLM